MQTLESMLVVALSSIEPVLVDSGMEGGDPGLRLVLVIAAQRTFPCIC